MENALLEKMEDMGAEVEDTLERLMGDEELYLEYLTQFPENQSIKDLRHSVDAGDCEQAMKDVHTLKGMALNLGILPLVDVCMDMLLDFREGNKESAMEQIDAVEECFQEWATVIRENC